ncbi:MAG: VPLPA-CTERM sorting domain-containing protein [Aestuariivirga sp.]|nr:VPLPA-CTERM sorting domain-containing protein [Aestuariivirga sp.]
MARLPALAAAAIAMTMLLGGARPVLAETVSLMESAKWENEAVLSEADAIKVEKGVDPRVVSKDGTTYSFNQLKGKEGDDLRVSDQLSVAVQDSGSNTVSFTFYNAGGEKSSITDIYLTGTGGVLEVPGKITDQSKGVNFSSGASPPNLPVGTKYDFVATASADSNPPVYENGVNASGEYVTWTFALAKGATYDDVIKSMDSGTLRVGAFAPGSSGGSSSFINGASMGRSGDVTAVPLPAALWLMIGALGSLVLMSRRGGVRRQYIDLMSASSWARPASSRLAT